MKILFIIVILFFFISMVRLRFFISFKEEEGLRILLRVVFLKVFIYPRNEKKRKSYKVKSKKSKVKKKEKKKKKVKQKKDLFKIVELIKIVLKPIPKFLKCLNKGFKISELKFKAKISREDAKETALFYSNFCKIFYNALGVVSSYCKIAKKDVDILLDFLGEKTKFCFKICFRIRIGTIIKAVFIYLFYVIIYFFYYGILKNKRSV